MSVVRQASSDVTNGGPHPAMYPSGPVVLQAPLQHQQTGYMVAPPGPPVVGQTQAYPGPAHPMSQPVMQQQQGYMPQQVQQLVTHMVSQHTISWHRLLPTYLLVSVSFSNISDLIQR